jgi:hypothetical protein
LYASALRKSKRVQPTKGIANIAKRERNRGAKQLDAFMKVSSLHPSLCYGLNSETLIVFTKSEIVFLWRLNFLIYLHYSIAWRQRPIRKVKPGVLD